MAKDRMTGSEMIVKALLDQGADVVFGYPGGAVLPIYDALFQQNQLRHILVRQEGGAVHAAEGYARSTGKVGVVLVTSGPGATNCVTGLDRCADGQHPVGLPDRSGADPSDRQRRVSGGRYGRHHPAVHQAQLSGQKYRGPAARPARGVSTSRPSGRPGPVVVDLPKDVVNTRRHYLPPSGSSTGATIRRSRATWRASRRGRSSGQGQAADHLCRRRRRERRTRRPRRSCWPIWWRHDRIPGDPDADGAGRLPGDDKQFLGMLGMHGTLRGQHGDARLRCHAVRRRALRRSGDRPARCVLARLQEDPHRHRRRRRSTRTFPSTCRSSATAAMSWRI